MSTFRGTPVFCTREDVKRALDSAETARNNDQIDRLVDAASRDIDKTCARRFYPMATTYYFDWPNDQMGRSWRLWLDKQEIISLSGLTFGTIAVSPSSVFLLPSFSGPPYSRIELNLTALGSFGGNTRTYQQSVAVTGVFGYTNATAPAGTLASPILATDTTLQVSDGSQVGVGDTLLIDSEYMQVIDRRMVDSGQAIAGAVAANANAVTLTVSNGAAFDIGEVLLIDSERMLIVDMAGNNLTVKRAWDGTVLAAHTAAEVWVSRTLLVTRGTLGTTAAAHSGTAAVARHAPPNLVRQLAIAETVNALQQEGSAYQAVQQRSRQLGAPGSARNTMTQVSPLDDLRNRVLSTYGRNVRLRVV